MRREHFVAVLVAFALAGAACAFDYQDEISSNGDLEVVTVGGLTFGKEVSVPLLPSEVPLAGERYSLCCRIVYADRALPRPETDEDLEAVHDTGRVLNRWLAEFVAEFSSAVDFQDLLARYAEKSFVQELNADFAAYVAKRCEAMPAGEKIDVDAVVVTVKAEGAFKEALERFREQAEREELRESLQAAIDRLHSLSSKARK